MGLIPPFHNVPSSVQRRRDLLSTCRISLHEARLRPNVIIRDNAGNLIQLFGR